MIFDSKINDDSPGLGRQARTTRAKVSGRARGRQGVESEEAFELRGQQVAYSCDENEDGNLIEWDEKF
ncbi:MAG: hypothetical protein AB7T22_16830 [Calditrichaceae bacterium]